MRVATRIEALTIATTITLAMAIVLPGLAQVRQMSMRTNCAVNLRTFAIGMTSYASENDDYLAGENTSGVALRGLSFNELPLNDRTAPVQSQDWIGPTLQYVDDSFAGNRAERWFRIMNHYRCPANAALNETLFGQPNDRQAFDNLGPIPAVSYISSVWFHRWGDDERLINDSQNGRVVVARRPGNNWEVRVSEDYRSRLSAVGPAERKSLAMDGTRFLGSDGILDADISVDPALLGSFTDFGPWWAGSTSHGVALNSLDWANRPVQINNSSNGGSLQLSYRRGLHTGGLPLATLGKDSPVGSAGDPVDAAPLVRPTPDGSVRNNSGTLNVVFFDGSVRNMSDRESREVEYWYPSNSVVQRPREGLTLTGPGFVIP